MNINDAHRGIKRNTKRLRIGRGPGSGRGKTSGRGHKGQGQLAGWSAPGIFEGARMPLIRRIPKRGFNNMFGKSVGVVNVGDLESAFQSGDEVTIEALKSAGLCKRPCDKVKVLGNGELTLKLKIVAHQFSATALEKIKKAGGEAVVIAGPKPVERKKPKKAAAAK